MEGNQDLITKNILSKPARLKQLLREHLGAFTPVEQHCIDTCLPEYKATEAAAIAKRVDRLANIYPELRKDLYTAWQYHPATYAGLHNADQLFQVVVGDIKAIHLPLTIDEQLDFISLIAFYIPIFNYEEVVTVTMFHDNDNNFSALDISDTVKRAQYLPFINSVKAIMDKNFTGDDIQTINQTLRVVYGPHRKGTTAGIELLRYFMPNVILYHNEKNLFVDPSIEYADTPADTWEVGESVESRIQIFGDINFFERGFTEDTLKQALRVVQNRGFSIYESGTFELPFEKLAAIHEELKLPLTHVYFLEGGHAKLFTVMEYEGKLFTLFEKNDTDPMIFAYSLEQGPTRTCSYFEYAIDPEKIYLIKPFQM